MHDMTMGSNVSLTALSENVGSAIVSLGWSSPTGEGDADVSVLLLDANGKVRSDADFYFYNNPVAADGSVQLLPKESNLRITGFRLSLFKGMGSGRGNAESGFIRSVDDAVHRFYTSVVAHLDAPASGRAAAKERAAV
ncbi:hypothetical protein GTY47_38850 [Streptomyces sp. SID5464]|nr:hypothetical protein [Streptomyces sp. SID5464]